MADNSETPTPVKATGPRRTMAPAARRPSGEDEYDKAVAGMSTAQLDELQAAINRARRGGATLGPPSFGMSEGERVELEMHGKTRSPWTGGEITGDGTPRTAE